MFSKVGNPFKLKSRRTFVNVGCSFRASKAIFFIAAYLFSATTILLQGTCATFKFVSHAFCSISIISRWREKEGVVKADKPVTDTYQDLLCPRRLAVDAYLVRSYTVQSEGVT